MFTFPTDRWWAQKNMRSSSNGCDAYAASLTRISKPTRLFCCVATLMSRQRNATYTMSGYGRAAYCSATPNARQFKRSRIGDLPTPFVFTRKLPVIIHGGTIGPGPFVAITDCEWITFGSVSHLGRQTQNNGLI